MSTELSPNIMMIGPTKAGKTTLLSVLRLASLREMSNGRKVDIEPVSQEAKELFRSSFYITKTGQLNHPGTLQASKYIFNLHCPFTQRVKVENIVETSFFGMKRKVDESYYEDRTMRKSFTLTVLDGRGGHVFGERSEGEDKSEYERSRGELIELAASSVALIVCLNASDPKTTEFFFQGLLDFLDDVRAKAGRVPFERVVMVMTQADRLVEDLGNGAQIELEQRNAAAAVSDAMGFFARSSLFQSLQPATLSKIYAGWASVYGFCPGEGSVNYDSKADRIAIYRENDAKWTDHWHPYGIVEPFLFACTGEPVNLVPMKK